MGVIDGAGQRGDRFRHGIGLLSREASLLEREGGDVARGKDVLDVADPSELVDRNEAVLVVGESGKPRPFEHGQGDHAVGEHLRPAGEQQHAAARHRGERRGSDDDASGLEQRAHRVGGGGAEQLERLLLGRDQRHPDVTRAVLAQVGGGHQRELVQGQRPHSLRRERERHRSGPSRGQVVEQAAQRRDVVAAAERECARKRGARARLLWPPPARRYEILRPPPVTAIRLRVSTSASVS